MQQAIYNNALTANNTITANTALLTAKTPSVRKTTLLRHLALKWDMYGVALLMASSAAYGAFALAYVA